MFAFPPSGPCRLLLISDPRGLLTRFLKVRSLTTEAATMGFRRATEIRVAAIAWAPAGLTRIPSPLLVPADLSPQSPSISHVYAINPVFGSLTS